MKKRMLMITCHKLSDNNGGSNASKGYVRCMSEMFDDCSLIFPEFTDTEAIIPSNYKLFPFHDSRSKLQKGIDMYRGAIVPLWAFACQHLREHQYDVVVIDHSLTASRLVKRIKATGAKLITIHHNVERFYLRDNGREHPLTYRLPYLYFAKKAERDSLLHSDVNLTISENDANIFRSWYPQRNIHAHRWGVFEYRPIANKQFPLRKQDYVFVITGSLYFLQSLHPIMEFLDRYWPLLRKMCSQARLIIAGRNPHPMLLERCASDSSITVIANSDNMTEVVGQAQYYICPINAGSGVKLRIFDGLRQGQPILCHKISEAGYESLKATDCLFTYDDIDSFRHSLIALLATDVSPAVVYQNYQEHFSYEAGTARLHHILGQERII